MKVIKDADNPQKEQERSDREHRMVRWIVQDLQRRGINAEVVARAHMIPLEGR